MVAWPGLLHLLLARRGGGGKEENVLETESWTGGKARTSTGGQNILPPALSFHWQPTGNKELGLGTTRVTGTGDQHVLYFVPQMDNRWW